MYDCASIVPWWAVINMRHSLGGNMLFFDMHVGYMKYTQFMGIKTINGTSRYLGVWMMYGSY